MCGMAWKPSEIPDQTGRVIVITGANGGLGAETAKALAARGATVIMACRNAVKANRVADAIPGDVQVASLDLSDLSSVRAFAAACGPIDVLINNAGLMNIPFSRTEDGFETQFAVNHLGHFALTGLLLDRIQDRIVTLASIAHRRTSKLRIDDVNYQDRRYVRSLAYAQTKLANLMFAGVQRRLTESGRKQRSYAVHPGVCATDLFARTETPLDRIAKPVVRLVGHPPARAAHSSLFAATMPDADPDLYWGPSLLFGARDRWRRVPRAPCRATAPCGSGCGRNPSA